MLFCSTNFVSSFVAHLFRTDTSQVVVKESLVEEKLKLLDHSR
jgi:hypothetical protein